MTDEEMAEEYKRQFYGVTSLFGFSDIEQAFLAGLKAGRPQWHKVADGDLPKEQKEYWCDYDDGCGKGFYDKDDGGWWIEGHLFCSNINAWCEILTFNKE